MSRLLPLLPFVAALSLLACQRDGPVADDAAAPPDGLVGDASASGLAAPGNSGAAEAADRAALPPMASGMAWFSSDDGRAASYGPPNSEAMLTIACDGPRGLVVTRHHPAPAGASGTLSLTGGGHVASLPMATAPTTLGPGEAVWQGRVSGDMARAIERPFSRGGRVELGLGGAPSIVVPASAEVKRVIARCLRG